MPDIGSTQAHGSLMKIMRADHKKYWNFRRTDRMLKELNTLVDIVRGVVIDDAANRTRADFLGAWISEYEEAWYLHPERVPR
jgi:hypothetical protein